VEVAAARHQHASVSKTLFLLVAQAFTGDFPTNTSEAHDNMSLSFEKHISL
jgi:hypothetical protein